MKIEFLLYSSFSNILFLISLVLLANVALAPESTQSTSADQKLGSSDISANGTTKQNNTIAKVSSSAPTDNLGDGNKEQNENTLKNQLHIFKIKPGYFKKQRELKLNNEKSDLSKMPTFQRTLNRLKQFFNDQPQKRGIYLDPYYPMFYHHNHFGEYGRSAYQPYLYPKNYGMYNFGKKVAHKRNRLDDEKELPDDPDRPHMPLLSQSNANRTIHKDVKTTTEPSDETDTEDIFESENMSDLPENYPGSEVLDLGTTTENETNNETSTAQNAEVKVEPTYLGNDVNLDQIAQNRIYFEKVPPNLNLSWFVYVNCSRESCQFTNSTNETDLLNEGWILHNCTNYGCTEMYANTESIQRFIGLMLLVFSLCIFKIVVFLMVFYYCRHIKLAKKATQDKDPPSWDEEKSDFHSGKTQPAKDADKKTISNIPKNQAKQLEQTDDFEPTSPDKDTDPNSVNVIAAEKADSKVWVPPAQNVSPCLLSSIPTRNILIPKKTFDKKVHDVKNSKFSKSKKRGHSSIPRLERLVKCNDKSYFKSESGKNILQKISKGAKPASGEDGDLLLLNLDDEINSNLYSPGNIAKNPTWEALLEDECKSFISLDLTDDK